MNKNKLLALLAEHGENCTILAQILGISRVTLSRKLNETNGAYFTQPEIATICARYRLPDDRVMDIFFRA